LKEPYLTVDIFPSFFPRTTLLSFSTFHSGTFPSNIWWRSYHVL